ncbi:excinuclease ATPase subunit [Phytohalomonas tamaricis]|uniref:excinuclease ATPase subunit n=1 Tax=Phytohalomonas tamaricis TaxID=2081032 RepID=UPI0021D45C3F|nr:excinuclease ATPase subunit [Phytohalomonas tamaricis]
MPLKSYLAATAVCAAFICAVPGQAQARDTFYMMPYKDVLALPDAQQKLDPAIRMYFGDQVHPEIQTRRGGYFTERKTNSVTKSDEGACRWVALSALIDLQERARQVGANAIVNIVSYYDKRENSDNNRYECHAGNVVAGVTLKGDMVTIK